jgi:DNA-binding transcriptional regulator YhcF (GntR family)
MKSRDGIAATSGKKRRGWFLQMKPTRRSAVCLCTSARNNASQGMCMVRGSRGTQMIIRDHGTDFTERPYNNLLKRLSASDFASIAPYLTPWDGQPGDLLYSPGDDVEVVHFPIGPSLASYLVASEDGRDVETILVGREGAVGGIVSQGYLPAYTRIVVKFGGPFQRLHVSRLQAAKAKSVTLHNTFSRYADCMLAQIFQSTACNAIHSIEQRTAKWIMAAMERNDRQDAVPLTHEQLATLLGVGRSYISRVMQTFKSEGVLETRRGSIIVRNHDALRQRACHCNEAVKHHFEEVLQGVYPINDARSA